MQKKHAELKKEINVAKGKKTSRNTKVTKQKERSVITLSSNLTS